MKGHFAPQTKKPGSAIPTRIVLTRYRRGLRLGVVNA